MEPFDYRYPNQITRAGTPTEELYGGGYGKSSSWIGYAKSFADIVNGCVFGRCMSGHCCMRFHGSVWLRH